jgi:hypothetical protein
MDTPALDLSTFAIFGDDVYTSTDLNRRSGEVLNHALLRPVTISRNGEHFALLKREQASGLVQTAAQSMRAIQVLEAVLSLGNGGTVAEPLSWLTAFDADDRAKMCREIVIALGRGVSTRNWEDFEAVLHEWRESGLVAQSGVLDHTTSAL